MALNVQKDHCGCCVVGALEGTEATRPTAPSRREEEVLGSPVEDTWPDLRACEEVQPQDLLVDDTRCGSRRLSRSLSSAMSRCSENGNLRGALGWGDGQRVSLDVWRVAFQEAVSARSRVQRRAMTVGANTVGPSVPSKEECHVGE